jgi:hypothetical protein
LGCWSRSRRHAASERAASRASIGLSPAGAGAIAMEDCSVFNPASLFRSMMVLGYCGL